jgi:uncharacterized membrane protein YfcA
MTWIIPIAAGLAAGILSGWGIGGGTLLMIYMVSFVGVTQTTAQGINLLFFIPTSATALVFHIKNKLVDKSAAVIAIIAGTLTSIAASLVATAIDVSLLKKCFGIFLLIVGISELLRKNKKRDTIPPKSKKQ